MNPLEKLITDKINRSNGRISFAEYMAEVLYHSELGYYNRPDMTIGERGDFYTSPMVHPIFGQIVARQIYQLWKQLGSPNPFTIIEMGAGVGAMARDLLSEWDRLQQTGDKENPTQNAPELAYIIVEQSPVLREKQADTTAEINQGRIQWYSTLPELPEYVELVGVIVSNELFDALPVHRLIFQDGRLQERYVTTQISENGPLFAEVTGPLSDASLAAILPDEVRSQLAEGDRVEVSPFWDTVLRQMAEALKQGFVLTIDYGDVSPDVYWKAVNQGGIRCYYRQALVTDPYERVGLQDITADVDFSFLVCAGNKHGLQKVWYSNQTQFLERFGFLDKVTELQRLAFKNLKYDFEMQRMLTLYLPQGGLGDACKVLIQRKEELG